MIKKILVGLCVFLLAACQSQDKNTLKVGTIAGPETQLMEVAKEVAKKQFGLNLKIIEFNDYMQPNIALNDGDLDANMCQHQPFLDQEIKNKHYHLITIGKTFVYPMGIYSVKIKSLQGIPNKAIVSLPNDSSNEGRALLLLQKAGLIKLKKTAGLYATPIDVIDNPKDLRFNELAAAQTARSLQDVDLAVINTNFAIPAGLSPTKDAIYLEDKDSPYANIIVAREQDKNDPRLKQLITAFQSPAVMKAAQKIFKDQAIPAW